MSTALFLCLAWGILTLWVRDRWAVASFQSLALLLAAACLVDAWKAGRQPRWHPLLWPLAAVPCWGLCQLAAGWSVDPWNTSEAVLIWTGHLAVAFVAVQLAGETRRFRLLFAVFGTVLALEAMLQCWTAGGTVFWLFDSGYTERVFGPFVYHNKFAQFVELVLPVVLFQSLKDRNRAPLWFAAAALLFGGILASASRSGLLMGLLELGLLLATAYISGTARGKVLVWSGVSLALLAVAGGLLAGWSGMLERVTGLDPRMDLRLPIWKSTLAMIRERPATGFGLGSFPIAYPAYADMDIGLIVNTAHQDWLQWAAEGGVPMLLAMLWFTGMAAPRLLRSLWGVGALVVLVHGLMDYPMHQNPAFASLLIAVVVLAVTSND
ncbi:O-antigen ligase family protein [Paludibaculum fermentans]|uniref:O-antigen ligase family protein n=1 Tax=Paludibaculum fermentans TaxID=1473598 RepID=A0A7S7NLY2_PALFE|nr:O-antigen ligase family protein [Paludibaculum fermentans]QOY86041.1 O-antigen ligase family protein [Paludibaculum fermentans]